MPRTAVTGPELPTSTLPFSPAVRAGDLIFVSGQASVDDVGTYIVDTFAGEMTRAFDNVSRILAACGGTLDDVVQVRSYLGDMAYRGEYNDLYRNHFSDPLPARTTTSGGIGELKFEVDVVAHIPESRS